MNSYYQTQGFLSVDDREKYEVVAKNQEQLVLEYFQRNSGLAFTPETVQLAVLPQAPITSVRRAITNLTNAGELEKVGSDEGRYGRPVGTWRLKAKKQEGWLF